MDFIQNYMPFAKQEQHSSKKFNSKENLTFN